MTLRHDPLLSRALARGIGRRWEGERAASLHLAREPRAAELRFRDAPSLLFLLHPEEGFLLASEPVLAGEGTSFRRLFLGEARTPPDERILLLPLVDRRGRERHRVAVELHTNQWNLLLLDVVPPEASDSPETPETPESTRTRASAERRQPRVRVQAALWPRRTAHRALEAGAPYELPPGDRAWAERPPSREAWRELLGPVPPGKRRGAALRGIAWLSSVNVGHVLGAASEEAEEGNEATGASEEADAVRPEADVAALDAAHERYLRLRRAVGIDSEGERARDDAPGTERGDTGASGAPGSAVGEPRATGDPTAWLLARPWGDQPYPASLDEPEARRLPSLLEAMEAALGGAEARERRARELAVAAPPAAAGARGAEGGRHEAARLRRALLARRERLRKRKAGLSRELERGPAPEELRSVGNLLLARLRDVPRGASSVTLEGFEGEEREIELDPSLEPAANAEAYFEEAGRRERARERIPAEIAAAERSLRAIEEGLEQVEAALVAKRDAGGQETDGGGKEDAGEEGDGADADSGPSPELDEARIEGLWELTGGRPEPGGEGREGGERRPYLRYRSSGGLEIRVGRSARANDELTFHHSSPEDIWLHARQVQGAHVILRWDRKEENPPRRDLLEAALAAAVHSGARHSGTVAVDWTRRKYVRKPRKAPPGAVLPDRVQTLFVEPDAELLERMKLED